MLNPLLVASLWLMVALGLVFARRERLWSATALLIIICHPFLYFLLYYSYHSQAFSVLLVAAGLLLAELNDRSPSPAAKWRGAIAAGLFFAAAILHYPSAFLAPVFYLAINLAVRFRRGGPATALVCGATVLVAAGYHLPRTFRELAWLGHAQVLPGWEWHRLVNVHELLGLRSLIAFAPLPPGDFISTLVTLASTLLLGAALFIHLRRGALPLASAAVLLATGVLAVSAYVKFWQGIPYASHGLAKAVSQYAPFILVFATAGAVAAFPHQRRKAQLLVLIVLGFFALIQFLQVARWRRAVWLDYDLITLVERHAHDAIPLAFDPGLDSHFVAPLVKDDRRLAVEGAAGPRLHFTLASRQAGFPDFTLVDREGAYLALRAR
jgi:hypothetical protein